MLKGAAIWLNRSRSAWLMIGYWVAAVAVSLLFDMPIARRVYSSGLYARVRWSHIAQLSKVPGSYYFTLVLAAILLFWHRSQTREAALVCISGLTAGLFYVIGKWIVGRRRPIFDRGVFNTRPFAFEFFHGGFQGAIYSHPNLSFPSGHVCLAFSTATALTICLPRWRVPFFLVAASVAAERVLEGAHYLSDVTAGAGLGVLAAILTARILQLPLSSRYAVDVGTRPWIA
jgi:membrane-associated phospholipid phosphatase